MSTVGWSESSSLTSRLNLSERWEWMGGDIVDSVWCKKKRKRNQQIAYNLYENRREASLNVLWTLKIVFLKRYIICLKKSETCDGQNRPPVNHDTGQFIGIIGESTNLSRRFTHIGVYAHS
ncbi:hypothetical protein RRG08_027736 [Elysia crispata]|uniref:Uncharacterized protein n=1 Tax=Elysia crispata TaxID=231223 RepID=A0AAE0YA45_9GAST|nr:hypothetical protein RRG08_027736 [Elysia crispata]